MQSTPLSQNGIKPHPETDDDGDGAAKTVEPGWSRLGRGGGVWFHRLDRPGPVWAVVVCAVVGLVAGQVLLYVAGVVQDVVPPAGVPVLGSQTSHAVSLVAIALSAPVAMAVTVVFWRRPAGTLLSVVGRIRWRWLGWCVPTVAVAVVFVDTVLFRRLGVDGQWVGWSSFLPTVTVVTVLAVGQVVGEEVVFRGLLLQAFGRLSPRPWPAIVCPALLWTLVHWPSALTGAVVLTVFGCMLGYMAIRTGGIEATIACHVVLNTLANVYQIGFWDTPDVQVPVDQNAGDLNTYGMVLNLYLVTCLCGVLALLAWWRRPANTASLPTVGARP